MESEKFETRLSAPGGKNEIGNRKYDFQISQCLPRVCLKDIFSFLSFLKSHLFDRRFLKLLWFWLTSKARPTLFLFTFEICQSFKVKSRLIFLSGFL